MQSAMSGGGGGAGGPPSFFMKQGNDTNHTEGPGMGGFMNDTDNGTHGGPTDGANTGFTPPPGMEHIELPEGWDTMT